MLESDGVTDQPGDIRPVGMASQNPNLRPGYRVYFIKQASSFFLLAGRSKSSAQRTIRQAKGLLHSLMLTDKNRNDYLGSSHTPTTIEDIGAYLEAVFMLP